MLPKEDYIYYADILHVPYGVKPKDEVRKYIFDAADFLVDKGVKALVIACNTATSIAIEDLRLKYNIPIIGMEPAVKPAVENNKDNNKRVLVTATPLTLKEERLRNLIDKLDNEHIVDSLPLQGLVEFSEKLEFNEEIVLPYLKEQLHGYDLKRYETVVLGCTHFSFYKDMFRKLFTPNVNIIDGNIGTVKHLKRMLKKYNLLNDGSGEITYYNTGKEVNASIELGKFDSLFRRLYDINE